jgi:hypothetical protein
MTDVHIISGKTVEKKIGKGSIAVVTDAVVAGLVPYLYNGQGWTIVLKTLDSQENADVGPKPNNRYHQSLITLLAEKGDSVPITFPGLTCEKYEAWKTAAEMLEALAKAARVQATKCMLDE